MSGRAAHAGETLRALSLLLGLIGDRRVLS
jgi:hypothetical protein